MQARLPLFATFQLLFVLLSGNPTSDVKWSSKRSQIVHHSLDKTHKHSQQEAGWLPVQDSCAENLEIPKVAPLLQYIQICTVSSRLYGGLYGHKHKSSWRHLQ